jgi:hypothetical protein
MQEGIMKNRKIKYFAAILVAASLAFSSSAAFGANKNTIRMDHKQIVNMCRDGWNNAAFYRPSPRTYSTLTFANNTEFLNWASANEDFPYLSGFSGAISLEDAAHFITDAAVYYYPSVMNTNEAIHYVCADLNGDWYDYLNS